jgi:hypothetical protein
MPSLLFPPAVTACIAILSITPVHAEWSRVIAGTVDQLAASSTHVAAIRGARVWLFADDGAPVGRLAPARAEQPAPGRGDAEARRAEDILDRYDVAMADRDSDWALELVADELTLAQRHAAASARRSVLPDDELARPTVAASDRSLWIAARRGAWRVDSYGHTSRITLGAAEGALAASPAGLLLVTSDGLTLLHEDGTPSRSFALPHAVRYAALSASGSRMAWSAGTTVEWLATDQRRSFQLPTGVRQLVYCGETLVAMASDAVLMLPPDGAPAPPDAAPHARRWFCGGDARPWLAVGQQLWVSVDEGLRWSVVPVPAGAMVTDAAATAHHVWLATNSGLFVSSAGAAAQSAPALPGPGGGGKRRKARADWLSWLPTLSVQAMTRMAAGRREVQALASAQIPLEPRRLPVLRAAFDEPAVAPIPAATLRSHGSIEPPDPDRGCLAPARRKAVERALAEPARAESYVARAGHAAWLPELRLLVSRRYGRSESLDLAVSSSALSSPLGIDTVNDIRYEARATWDLGKLVFSTEELAAQNQALHMAELRRDIENTMNRLYFERRRLAVEPGGPEPWARRVRVREIEAELDALSAGAFGACIDPKP